VLALTAFERRQLSRLPYHENAYRKFLGVPKLFGEQGFTPWQQRTARPTLEINGLTSVIRARAVKPSSPLGPALK